MNFSQRFTFLFSAPTFDSEDLEGLRIEQIIAAIQRLGFQVVKARRIEDAEIAVQTDAAIGCLVVDWGKKGLEGKAASLINLMRRRGLEMPIVLLVRRKRFEDVPVEVLDFIDGYVFLAEETPEFIARNLVSRLTQYAEMLKTPFFGALVDYAEKGNQLWTCPGHNGGIFYSRSPIGRIFKEHLGEAVFRDDLDNSVLELGDLLTHEGPALRAEQEAAAIFGAERTYFVLNGTSASNKIVSSALIAHGDLVLFDRNNHKAAHHGALLMSGGIRAIGLSTRIINMLSAPYELDGSQVTVGTSIGIAMAPDDAGSGADLLKMADIALYETKSAGRNSFRFFEPAMLKGMDDRRRLEAELRTGIQRHEFELHYQPLVDIKTRRQKGFEALLRWRNPDRGWMLPDQFIPLAEETGLIAPLGAWVLQQACMDAARRPSHIKVAVNLSPIQLARPDLLEIVLCALVESSLEPERLELEITETALFNHSVDCVRLIRQLKHLGVSISLDDFGTGYSSLSYLTMFPFDKIKIDRSFTANMTTRAACAAIVAAVLALGHNLNVETVAEGVETEEQFEILRATGITQAQGYLFGRPCPASALIFDSALPHDLVESAA